MNIQHPSTARTLSFSQKLLLLVFGTLFLTIALGLFAAQPAHAAPVPSLCKITGYGPDQYGRCATLTGAFTETEIAGFKDNNCYALVIDSTKIPVTRDIKKVDCETDSNFADINKGSQTEADFKKCNDATSKEDGCVAKYISMAIAFLSGGVGIVVVIMIIIGGIQYTSSSGDPQKVGAAKQKIFNAVLALVAWVLLLGFLNYLVPGGLF